MKKTGLFALILSFIFAFATLGISFTDVSVAESNPTQGKEVTILFTHDIHSHLDSFNIMDESGEVKSIGGIARMSTLIKEKKQANPDAFLFDGGDFSMGTLYHTLYTTHASELVTLGRLGFDATTLGNHEFDFGQKGLWTMLYAAKSEAERLNVELPQLVVSNIDWNKNKDKEDKELKAAMDAYGASEYTIIEKGGVRCGVFGLMGEESAEDAPLSGIEFESIIEAAKKTVAQLKAENCDLIVALSHTGTLEGKDDSEDLVLAREVPEIDFILSAHSHRYLPEAIVVGKTVIGSVRCYGQYLGEVKLVSDGSGRWNPAGYETTELDKTIPDDPAAAEILQQYKPLINAEYLSRFGYEEGRVLAKNDNTFMPLIDMEGFHNESNTGNIIADAYIYAVYMNEGDDYEPVAVALSPVGVIRDSIMKGEVTVKNAFEILSLGIGPDGIAGYPLVECYLTAEEIKTLAEVDVSVSKLMPPAQLYPSGAKWEYNNHRLLLNRVTDVRLVDTSRGVPAAEAYTEEGMPLENGKLYRVVGGLYSMQMMSAVESKSYGILKVQPKDKDGNIITDFNKCILYDKSGNEIKEWYALASYLESFEQGDDGVPVIPDRYAGIEGRKVKSDSRNIIELLKGPNVVGRAVYALIGIIIITVLGIVTVVKKLKKKKKRK
ncbi:MAG: bifunctional metallophosphatase/5'-nucleotidase [Firmicutes bacterium]|nr:bifunctional metallophosphatase/5'-nucleotidase [Bacillota bacterium]